MSRVIKAAVWQEKPCVVEIPKESEQQTESMDEELTPEIKENLLAGIREKQKRADEILRQAGIDADIIRQKAEAEADSIRAQAREEAETVKQDAMKQGYDEGFAKGEQDGIKKAEEACSDKITEAAQKAEKTIHDAEYACDDYVSKAEDTVAELAMHVVEKILPQHFIDVPQVLLPVVRDAIKNVRDQCRVVVSVAPAAYDMVLMARTEFQSMLSGNAALEIRSDETLGPGDVIVETPNGTVDAKLATQMDLVKQALSDMMSQH